MHINNPRARTEVLKFIEEDNLIDVYRNLHDEKGFTWRKLNPVIKQARPDFFLVSEESFEFVYDNCVVSGYRTDHSGTILKLKFNNNERGKGYWKFNNSLLKDNEYIQIVKKAIEEVKNTYKIIDVQQDREFNNNNDNNNNNINNNNNNNNINNNNNNINNNNNDNNNNNNINNDNNDDIENTYSINDQLLLEMILLAIRGETIKYSSRKKKRKY